MKKNKFVKKIGLILTSAAVAVGSFGVPIAASAGTFDSDIVTAADTSSKVVAFPGAEGGGMYTSGARGALDTGEQIEVYHVTNLNDSGEGSFRDAVSKGNRIVVFDVSGYIDLASNVTIGHDNMTILGQTAPGDGVTFRTNNIKVGANNVILRYLKFRVGAHDANGNDTRAQDGLEVTDDCQKVIIDHCSVSWGTDENLSAYAVKDVTIQNSIISEALNQSVHDKGEHSYGAIWGGVNLSIHHNIIASHKSRNPKIGTSETVAMTAGYTDAQTLVDIKNNIFYNWGDKAGYGTENGAKTYIQNNIYRPGPATPAGKRARIFELSVGQKYQTNMLGSVYAVGNMIDVEANDSDYADAQSVNQNNWQDDKHIGVYVDTKFYDSTDKSNMIITTPDETYQTYNKEYPITLDDTEDVFDKVIANAGATLPKRDKVDERIISDVVGRTAPTGSKGSIGLVDDPIDGVPSGEESEYDGRGYPIITPETRDASYDTDGDGIPDTWEDEMGLNKENPNDSTYIGPKGYTYLEIFTEEGISYEPGAISLSVDSFEATVKSPTGESVDIYVDDKLVQTVDFDMSAPKGSTLITAGYDENDVLVEMQSAVQASEGAAVFPELTKDAKIVKHFIWDSLENMQPIGNDTYETTVNLPVSEAGVYTVTAVGCDSGSYSNIEYICASNPQVGPYMQSGDFNLVMKLNQIPTNVKNAYGFVSMANGSVSCLLGAGTDENYAKTIYLNDKILPLGNTVYLRAHRTGDTITLYSGESLLSWTELAKYTVSEEVTVIGTGDNKLSESDKFAANISTSIITNTSSPKISIVNVTENQRLGFDENIEVNVQPDGALIQEIDILLNGTVIASQNVSISEAQTVTIPISFEEVNAGVLEVACVDENLCTSIDSRNVTISADPTPWQLIDIGMPNDTAKTYVQVTSDFTYKMFCPTGGTIGGTSDTFGYMYQQFEGNNRLYFRIRPQTSSQYGIVLRSDLDPDGIAYYFGCDDSSTYKYNLKARTSKGGEMQLIETPIESGADKRYLIVEKLDNMLNIYETNDSSPMYTQENPLTSIDCSLLGDKYYMGFGVTGTNAGDFGDIGWTGIETLSTDDGTEKTEWNFDYGLDWRWQLQEANVLTPSWTNESIAGNNTGKMMISTSNDYEQRYVLHEYTPGESEMVVKAEADILLSGDEVGMNVYLNDGDASKAFKVSFTDEGSIALGDIDAGVEYETQKWYHITYGVDEGIDKTKAAITITDADGNIVVQNDEVSLTSFRSQIDSKKAAIKNGIFFEAISGKTANYYIDNVSVSQAESSVKIERTASWYTFKGITELSGAFSVNGTTTSDGDELSGEVMNVAGGATLATKSYNVAGVMFSNRIRLNKNKAGALTVPVQTGAIVTVYCGSANSSSTRSLFINGTEYSVLAADAYKYTYDGAAGTIEIYAADGIDVYGVSVETVNIIQ